MRGALPRPALLHRNSEGRRSRAPHPFLPTAAANFGGEKLALLDVEAPLRHDLPFVEARAAEGLAVGASLAGSLQFNDVGHPWPSGLMVPVLLRVVVDIFFNNSDPLIFLLLY